MNYEYNFDVSDTFVMKKKNIEDNDCVSVLIMITLLISFTPETAVFKNNHLKDDLNKTLVSSLLLLHESGNL